MAVVSLHTPISEKQARSLKLGDEVFLSGDAYCMLYADHYKLVLDSIAEGLKLPMDLRGCAIYNTGVIWRPCEGGARTLYALGTTASYKFNAFGPDMIRKAGIRAIIGKGGMDDTVLDAMQECGCVFLAIPGGCTSIFTPKAEIVEEYLPAIPPLDNQRLHFRFTEFGPLTVTMDAHGNSIYHGVSERLLENRKKIYAALSVQ